MVEEEILAALRVVNAHRCQPPLHEGEVRDIAASVALYPPGPVFTSTPPDDTPPPPGRSSFIGPAGLADDQTGRMTQDSCDGDDPFWRIDV
jgi:hypothetical protein